MRGDSPQRPHFFHPLFLVPGNTFIICGPEQLFTLQLIVLLQVVNGPQQLLL
jgi:hypothetical protein